MDLFNSYFNRTFTIFFKYKVEHIVGNSIQVRIGGGGLKGCKNVPLRNLDWAHLPR